jgi:hypothetical protein
MEPLKTDSGRACLFGALYKPLTDPVPGLRLQNLPPRGAIGFFPRCPQNRPMAFPSRASRARRNLVVACALATLSFFASSLTLLAHTPGQLRHISAGGCYCKCAQSRTQAGCPMMCDLPKYLSRWWATSCMKPRMKPQSDTKGAGPKLPHPDRAEHAENTPK